MHTVNAQDLISVCLQRCCYRSFPFLKSVPTPVGTLCRRLLRTHCVRLRPSHPYTVFPGGVHVFVGFPAEFTSSLSCCPHSGLDLMFLLCLRGGGVGGGGGAPL